MSARLIVLGLLLSAAALALSQQPVLAQANPGALGQDGPQAFGGQQQARSPEIHADRSVTLRLVAPNAKEVRLTGQIIGPRAHWLSQAKYLPMNRDERGVWSITLGPLAPDIYEYGFWMDGVALPDPGNRMGYVEVPGQTAAFYDPQPVPHGAVRMEIYESAVIKQPRYVYVYTPPGYDQSRQSYPVLYLMHGGNCCETAWVQQVRANVILDNLIAQGRAKPMIVVMPLGARSGPSDYLAPVPAQMEGATTGFGGNAGAQSNYAPNNLFEQDLLRGIIPFIDRKYRTVADADHRGLSGLSQGGIQSFTIGLRHTDVFHWVAPMSAGAESQGDDQFIGPMKDVYENPEPLKRNLKLLYVTVGSEDVLHEADKRLVDRLRAGGVNVTFAPIPGRHQYSVWRRGLYDLAPRLFR